MKSVDSRSSRALAFFAAVALFGLPGTRAAASPQAISPQEQNWEVQVGQQQYAKYAQRGEIVPAQSPLYGTLDPIGEAVAAVANQEYFAPFHFILLNEREPNAFSMPGGNVYVTTAMLSYLRNRDELAGVICHEVNHDIHHDMYNVYQAGRGGVQPIGYERAAETNADRAGAYTCAKAGFNPWGMVWNMRQHRQTMEPAQQVNAMSDHPSDDQRLAALTAILTSDMATFGKFRDDVAASRLLEPLARPEYGVAGAQPQYQAQYPPQYQTQYPPQYQTQYPPQSPPQNSSQYPMQYPPYPPPPLPACYPGC